MKVKTEPKAPVSEPEPAPEPQPAPEPERAEAARGRRRETAESMATRQRSISVSEFFSKNRHLLGFDNPRKALLTAVKEAVDNSLDACEEAGLLPEVSVRVEELEGESRYRMTVRDNGPGIVRKEIPNVFGKLLYGSKFHRLRMSRGQQGIGISAAGMYGLLTTGKPVEITSRTGAGKPAHHFWLKIDTRKNRPDIMKDTQVEWDVEHGTEVVIELEGKHQKGRQSVDEYLRQVAVANPHVRITYAAPGGEQTVYERSVQELPPATDEIKPHPRGVELGVLQVMLKESPARTLVSFLQREFSRISRAKALEILAAGELSPELAPRRVGAAEVEALMVGIGKTKLMNPPTTCVAPIGEAALVGGLRAVVAADFYASTTRAPAVYRGNPFIIECALAYGGDQPGDVPARLLRYANRVPLLYQPGGCVSTSAATEVNWRNYGLQQPRGSLPLAPLTVVVHMASVWVPFTSESKEAIAAYPEIEEEMALALQECGRQLKLFLSRKARDAEDERKRGWIDLYLPHIGVGLRDLLGLREAEEKRVVEALTTILERRSARDEATEDSEEPEAE